MLYQQRHPARFSSCRLQNRQRIGILGVLLVILISSMLAADRPKVVVKGKAAR